MEPVSRPDVSHYAVNVVWSVEDREFVATCLEFPSLSWLASTQFEAMEGLKAVLEAVIEDMLESGEQIPEPFADRNYSGKFNVRMAGGLHRKLATRAAQDGVSLNQYVVEKLAAAG
jgi:predicted HicB family RNase H-like nuclease